MWWISQPLLDGAESRDVWISTQVEELDERMKKLTHKLENARRDMARAASEAYRRRGLGRWGGRHLHENAGDAGHLHRQGAT